MFKKTSFKRPGQASTFIPAAGKAQLCKTSFEVINKRTLLCTGTQIGYPSTAYNLGYFI